MQGTTSTLLLISDTTELSPTSVQHQLIEILSHIKSQDATLQLFFLILGLNF